MNNKEIKKYILNEINQLKIYNETLAESNFKMACSNATFKSAYEKLKTLELEKIKLDYKKEKTEETNKKIKQQKNKVSKILKTLNLDFKDLEPNYNCKKCCDTGVINNEYCTCFYKMYNEFIIKNLGININRNHTFSSANYKIFDNPEETKKLYNKILDWCKNIKTSNKKTIVLMGNTGVGKTYLTECICNELINKNIVVNYYTSFALNNLFYKYHTSFSESRVGLLDGVMNCDVLIIDDFGSEPKIKITEEYFYALFNERLNKNLATIVTTNLNPMQILDRYGERTFSRLNNKKSCALLKMNNKDLRLKKD